MTQFDPLPPGAVARCRNLALSISRPVEKFLHVEASSGVVLLVVAGIALFWANSPWAESYKHLLHTPIHLGLGEHQFTKTVHFWINDILMVLFFFVVGLEVRRELHDGQLSQLRKAAIPVAAAIGGMVVPVLFYLAIVPNDSVARDGWSVPMATDIAFAVGVLALLGNRVSAAMRILLLSIAIIDDIGAILIIAIFHSSGFDIGGVAMAGGGIAILVSMQWVGIRSPLLYIAPGILLWSGVLSMGIHPTIAGVILGLLTPVKSWFDRQSFLQETEQALSQLKREISPATPIKKWLPLLERINLARREVVSPLIRIETTLHPWVSFGVMPLFAFANAGVHLGELDLSLPGASGLAWGTFLGLVVGKPLGIVGFAWLIARFTGGLPQGVSWSGMLVLGCVAGIGFTMALFLGSLAFSDPGLLAVSKVAILSASLAAGVAGLALGFTRLPRMH